VKELAKHLCALDYSWVRDAFRHTLTAALEALSMTPLDSAREDASPMLARRSGASREGREKGPGKVAGPGVNIALSTHLNI